MIFFYGEERAVTPLPFIVWVRIYTPAGEESFVEHLSGGRKLLLFIREGVYHNTKIEPVFSMRHTNSCG